MILRLDRPLITLDVETHDKCPPEQALIVELGFKMLYPDGREPKIYNTLINPLVPIHPGATDVHKITNAMVQGKPTFRQLAANLAKGFTHCDYCGYNVRFDLRVIGGEMSRAGVEWSMGDARILDAMRLWQISATRTLSDAVREFLGRAPTEAHRALGDAEDALDVALAMLERFPNLPRDLGKLHDLCFDANNYDLDGKFIWADGEVLCNFGKHKGVKLRDMPKGYLSWMASGDFTSEVKKLVLNAANGIYPKKDI